MSIGKFFKITKEAILLYIKGELNEENLLNLINTIKLETEEKDEDIWEETLLIKKLFELKKYYEIENFIEEFTTFLNNMAYQRKGDKILIFACLESIKDKIHYRIYSQVDVHLYKLLKLYYIEEINQNNITIILKNSDFTDKIIGINVASNYAFEQMSFISLEKKDELREEVSKNNCTVKENIQENIKSIIANYYDTKTLKDFSLTLNNYIKNITLEKKQKNALLYIINLKMSYFTNEAREIWENKKKKAKKAIKNYTLPLDFK